MQIARMIVLAAVSIALAACGESEPAPPVKGMSLGDIASKLFEKPKLKPAPAQQLPPHHAEPGGESAPVFVPLPRPAPVVAAPIHQPTATKPKPKPKWQKKKAKPDCSNGIAGYSRNTIRLAGSAVAVERMAKARGHVVTAETRRQIQSCFNEG